MFTLLGRIPYYVQLGLKFIGHNLELLPLVAVSIWAFFEDNSPEFNVVVVVGLIASTIFVCYKPLTKSSIGHTVVLDEFQHDRAEIYKPSKLSTLYIGIYKRSIKNKWIIRFTPNTLSVIGCFLAFLSPFLALLGKRIDGFFFETNFFCHILPIFSFAIMLFCDGTDGPFAKSLRKTLQVSSAVPEGNVTLGEKYDAVCDHLSMIAFLTTLVVLEIADATQVAFYATTYLIMFAGAYFDTRTYRLEHIRSKVGVMALLLLSFVPTVDQATYWFLLFGSWLSLTNIIRRIFEVLFNRSSAS